MNLGLAPPNAVISPAGDLTMFGDNIGTETFGFRGCSCGGCPFEWPLTSNCGEWPLGCGTGGGCRPRELPTGSGGATWLEPEIDNLEPRIN